MANSRGIGSAKPKKSSGDSVKLEEALGFLKFNDHADEWVQIRLIERGLLAVKRHWVKIITSKQKQEIEIPRFCISFNPENEAEPRSDVECPYCTAVTGDRKTSPVTNEFFYLTNAIVRDIQEEEPSRLPEHNSKEKKSGFKDPKSKSWTPVRVVRLTNSVVARIQELGETNIVKSKKDPKKKKAFSVSHDQYGVDINVKFKPKAAGTDKYSVDKADDGRTPLTDEEKAYLVWDLDEKVLDICGRLTEAQALDDFKKMELNGGEEIDDDDEDDDDDDVPLSKKKKKSKMDKKSKKSKFDDDDDDDDDAPKKKKSKKSKLSDDEDDVPKKKKKKNKSSLDDDDEDDVPKKKSKKSKKSDDDDEDDAPKSKKKSKKAKAEKPSKKSSKKSKKSDDDDDDDDDVPKSKKKSKKADKKSGKKSSKKSKNFNDDDDDEW